MGRSQGKPLGEVKDGRGAAPTLLGNAQERMQERGWKRVRLVSAVWEGRRDAARMGGSVRYGQAMQVNCRRTALLTARPVLVGSCQTPSDHRYVTK